MKIEDIINEKSLDENLINYVEKRLSEKGINLETQDEVIKYLWANKKLFGQQERVVVEEAIGNRRDRDKKRYSRSRDRYRDRGRYKDRYYDRERYNRYKKNDSYPKHRYRKTGPKPTDICFNCHGYGHWANECQMPSKSK